MVPVSRAFGVGLTALLLAGSHSAIARSQGQRPLRVLISPAAVHPGDVIRLDVPGAPSDDTMAVSAFGQDIPLHFDGERQQWRVLLGVDLETKPGRYRIRLQRGVDAAILQRSLSVQPKRFAVRRLRVSRGFVDPSDEALLQITRDNLAIAAAYARTTPVQWSGAAVLPVPGKATSNFGSRSYYNGVPRAPHAGVDFSGAIGTPVVAPLGASVALAAPLYFTGNTVILDHGARLFSILAHLSEIHVDVDQAVTAGTIVGLVGATGRVTGAHLHWGVRLNGARVDPLSLVAATAE